MLGLAVHHWLREVGMNVIGLTRAHLDASLFNPRVIPLRQDDVVINCIGLINRRLPEFDPQLFLKVNALFPRLMADACSEASAYLIHVSTDCVFSGIGAPHDEDALSDAQDLYGQSKALGEPRAALVLRSSIIGPELKSHYSLMCWFLQHSDGARVHGYTNHLWNGMTTLQMARCVERLVRLGIHKQHRLLHLYSNPTTKHDLLCLLSTTFGRRITVGRIHAPEARDMRLSTLHPDTLRSLEVPPIENQIEDLKAVSRSNGHWFGLVA
jgi:dTDP-4-dehydrorhamnose reductase